jgi:hypothetical protein
MTTLQILIDGKLERQWNFRDYGEAKKADKAITNFIQKHIEKDYTTTIPFIWREEE